jgi:hypothetical protein
MNIKRIFGALLTALGIGGLIYTAVLFMNTAGGNQDIIDNLRNIRTYILFIRNKFS